MTTKLDVTQARLERLKHHEGDQLKEALAEELQPFLDGIRSLNSQSREYDVFKRAYEHYMRKHKQKREIINYILKRDSPLKLDGVGIVYALFLYLGMVESVGNSIVDIVVMLLVANGRDFHIECRYTTPRIRHVTSIRDLEKENVPLSVKLSFLRDNDVKRLASVVDTDLRNSIAHLNFDVNEGVILVNGKTAFDEALVGMWRVSFAVDKIEELLSKLAQDSIQEKEETEHD